MLAFLASLGGEPAPLLDPERAAAKRARRAARGW
jgi:hypothetical protein